MPSAVKIAILSCKILAHASVAVTKFALSKIDGAFKMEINKNRSS